MGLIVYVYRTAALGDSTAGGISSRHDTLTVVNVDGPFDPTDTRPAALIEDGPQGTVRIVPARQTRTGDWIRNDLPWLSGPMFGGNYASGDSRLREAAGFYGAIAIHDRYEKA